MKHFSLSSNMNFRLVASRSMKDFIEKEQKDGFYLNRYVSGIWRFSWLLVPAYYELLYNLGYFLNPTNCGI